MSLKLDYSDVRFRNNGRLKLLIIVGTRPEIIRLSAVITANTLTASLPTPGRTTITISTASFSGTCAWTIRRFIWTPWATI